MPPDKQRYHIVHDLKHDKYVLLDTETHKILKASKDKKEIKKLSQSWNERPLISLGR